MRGKLTHRGGNAEILGEDHIRYIVDPQEVAACKSMHGKWVEFEVEQSGKRPRAKEVRPSANQHEGRRRQGAPGVHTGPQGPVFPPNSDTPAPPNRPDEFVWTQAPDGFANPYNFVSFPGHALQREHRAAGHERFCGISGRLEVALTNHTPLFVPASVSHRGEWSEEEAAKYKSGQHGSAELLKDDKKVRYLTFFTDAQGQPALPGSSLKGVVRAVAEALSDSCFSQLDERKVPFSTRPFAHTEYFKRGRDGRPDMGFYRETQQYWQRQINSRLAGVLCRDNSGWYVQPGQTDKAAKVPEAVLYRVPQAYRKHGQTLWARLARGEYGRGTVTELSIAERPGFSKVILKVVEVPQDGNKKNQHAIVLRQNGEKRYPVPTGDCKHGGKGDATDLVRCPLCRADQAHEWQINEDGAGSPSLTTTIASSQRARRHPLKAGDIVIFRADQGDNVIDLGPVELYRVLHNRAPDDLFPKDYRPCSDARLLCPACRLFGMVAGERKEGGQALAGKVAFSGGRLTGYPAGKEAPAFMNGGRLIYLQPLGKPRPSCQQFYLQAVSRAEGKIHGYSQVGEIGLGQLRGRKFYWHHRPANPDEYWRYPDSYDVAHPFLRPETNDAQDRSRIDGQSPYVQPLLPGHTFTFTITFDNLSPAELGLLLAALQPNLLPDQQQRELWHKLGMAKPLGFGSVEVKVTSITLIDRKQRYADAFATGHYDDARQQQTVKDALQTVTLRPSQHELLDILDWDKAPTPISYPFADPKCREKSFEWFTANKTVPLPTIPQTVVEKRRLRYGNWRQKYGDWSR